MRKILYLFSLFISVTLAYPQSYQLQIHLQSGSSITYEVAEIRKIDFSNLTGLEDARKVSRVMESFKLLQNYPNPFAKGITS